MINQNEKGRVPDHARGGKGAVKTAGKIGYGRHGSPAADRGKKEGRKKKVRGLLAVAGKTLERKSALGRGERESLNLPTKEKGGIKKRRRGPPRGRMERPVS